MQRRPPIIPAIMVGVFGIIIITATPAIAADPIAGTWKLDVGSSKFFLPPPKEQTEVIENLPPARSR